MLKKRLKICFLSICFTMAISTSVFAQTELIRNGNFSNGLSDPWIETEFAPADADWNISNGKYNITILNKGFSEESIQLFQGKLTIQKGHTYNVQFTVESPVNCKVYSEIDSDVIGSLPNKYWSNTENSDLPFNVIANTPLIVNQTFTMSKETTTNGFIRFYVAGDYVTTLPEVISISDVHLIDLEDPSIPVTQPGDINSDGKINISDYIMLKKYIAGTLSTFKAIDNIADLNYDDEINSDDCTMLKNYIMGKATIINSISPERTTIIKDKEESINIQIPSNPPIDIYNDDVKLVAGTDYNVAINFVSGFTLTINKSYLTTLPLGYTKLKLKFDSGLDTTFKIYKTPGFVIIGTPIS